MECAILKMQRKEKELERPNRTSGAVGVVKKKEVAVNIPFSHAVNVRKHRTKKDTTVIDCVLIVEDGCRIQGKYSFKETGHAPINLGLVLSIDDLHRLLSYASNQESDFISQFSLILGDAIQQNQKGARGKHKGRETTVFNIKLDASLLYLLFTELSSKPLHDCPSFFQKLVNRLDDDTKDFIENAGQPYPVMLTAYCLEEYYGKTLSVIDLKPFFSEGFDSFFYTYIKPKLEMCEKMFSRMLIYKGVTHLRKRDTNQVFGYTDILAHREDMMPCDKHGKDLRPMPKRELPEDIINTPPFDFIFKKIGII